MQWAAWDARMSTPDESGVTLRAIYTDKLRRGEYVALDVIDGPEFPVSLEYLWHDRFQVLNGMRHIGMNGAEPLTPESIDAANRLFEWELTAREALALHRLDVAVRHPEVINEQQGAEPTPTQAWPTRAPEPA
jgi:hypothetical protein